MHSKFRNFGESLLQMFTTQFNIRWSDLDPNRHLANSAYINFMSASRMAYLESVGFSHRQFEKLKIGPVIFNEQIFYFKEVFPGKPITVTVELGGSSEDGMLFEFVHNFYSHDGKNLARGIMMGCWMDLTTRKMIPLPDDFLPVLEKMEKTDNYQELTLKDTRSHGVVPRDN